MTWISVRPNRAGSAEPLAIFGRAGSAESSVNLAEPPSLVLTKILQNFVKLFLYRDQKCRIFSELVGKISSNCFFTGTKSAVLLVYYIVWKIFVKLFIYRDQKCSIFNIKLGGQSGSVQNNKY